MPPPVPASRRRGLLALSITGVLWGSIGVVVRLLQNEGASTWSIAFWRFVCACVVLIPLLGRGGLRRLLRHASRPARILAVSLGSVAFQLTFFLAVRDVGVATATLIALGLAPVTLTAAQMAATRSFPPARTGAVLAIAMGGLALVTVAGGQGTQAGDHPARGIVEAVASGLCYAASTSWSGELSNRLEPLAITFASSFVGLVVLVPVVAVTGWQLPHATNELAGIVWLSVVATVLAYGLFYAGLRLVSGQIALILTLLEPATAVVLAAVMLGEPLTAANVGGGLLLLTAVAALYLQPQSV